MGKAKEIVILSGKGGTGKTTLATALAKIIENKIIVDADVDAADVFILLKPQILKEQEFKGKSIAIIDNEKCDGCDLCRQLCRFNAINVIENDGDNQYKVNPFLCDGCNLCAIACPENAIIMEQQIVGKWYISMTDWGDMVHTKLFPGAENSGNLVTMIKHQAQLLAEEKNKNLIIIDGPPGIGCPVTSSLSGASLALMVTEPTMSGIHDLKRVIEVSRHFKVDVVIVINKFDINLEKSLEIEEFAKKENIEIIGKIPFDRCIVNSQIKLNTIIDDEDCSHLKSVIYDIKEKIIRKIRLV